MTREDVISKIQSLFNVTVENGSSENEALAAALLAQKFIAKYDIKDDELFVQEEWKVVEVESKKVNRKIKYQLAMVIADNYRCKVFFNKYYRNVTAVFVGREIDANAAKLVYEVLYDAAVKYANTKSWKYRGHGAGLYGKFFNSAAIAFIDGVEAELSKQCKELILLRPKEVDEAYDRRVRGCKPVDSSLSSFGKVDYEEGVNAGRSAVQAGRIGGQMGIEG